MYRLFTFNSPLNVVLYAIALMALQIGWWINAQSTPLIFPHSEPLSRLLFGWLTKLAAAKSILQVSGVALSFLIAVIINQIVIANKITQQRSYVPGILFIVVACWINGLGILSPQLISFFLTVRVVQKMFAAYGKEKPYSEIFDAGWLSAFAMLFYFPSFWVLLFAIVGLAILRPFALREWWMVFIGFTAPIFMVATWYFWQDKLPDLLGDIINLPNISSTAFKFTTKELAALISGGILLLLALSSLPRILFSSVIQVRKFSIVLLLSGGFCFLSFFLQTSPSTNHLITMLLPISIFTAMYLQSMKSILIPEVIFGLLILWAITIQLFI